MIILHYRSLTILSYFLAIIFALVMVFSGGSLLSLISQLNLGVGGALALKLWGLSLPFYVSVLTPFGVYLAILMALSKFKQSHE